MIGFTPLSGTAPLNECPSQTWPLSLHSHSQEPPPCSPLKHCPFPLPLQALPPRFPPWSSVLLKPPHLPTSYRPLPRWIKDSFCPQAPCTKAFPIPLPVILQFSSALQRYAPATRRPCSAPTAFTGAGTGAVAGGWPRVYPCHGVLEEADARVLEQVPEGGGDLPHRHLCTSERGKRATVLVKRPLSL